MIIDLPIPPTQDELSLHRVGSSEDDETTCHQNEQNASSLCPHAISFGSFVYGIQRSRTGVDVKEGSWVSWKTSFAPFRVCRVTSNQDGSIVVCSTDAGTVALLRGSDGAVIATRKVSQGDDGHSIVASPHVSFLAAADERSNAVAIGLPSSQHDGSFLLVSNIDAPTLNDNNQLKVSDAGRNMNVQSIQFPLAHEMVAACGLFLDRDNIRFVTVDKLDTMGIYDYSCRANSDKARQITVVKECVPWGEDKSHPSSFDVGVGLRLHSLHPTKNFIIFGTFDSNNTAIQFMDPVLLKMVGTFQLPSTFFVEAHKRTKVLAIEPVSSAMSKSSIAVAVAIQQSVHDTTTTTAHLDGNEAMIRIIQAPIRQDGTLGAFHQVYKVPMDVLPLRTSFSLAMVAPGEFGYYSFRYKIYQSEEKYNCKLFVSGENCREGCTIGKIRLLIKFGRFNEADQLMVGEEDQLIANTFAEFHPSEVALGRLQHILSDGPIADTTNIAEAKRCFYSLSTGCISGNSRAGSNLLEAAESIIMWASPRSSQNLPTLVESIGALTNVSKVLEGVVQVISSDQKAAFEKQLRVLQKQLMTLKYLATSLTPKDPAQKREFLERFQGSRGPEELFANLIAHGYFSAAEKMWNSGIRPEIGHEAAIDSIIRLNSKVNPRGYMALLEGLIMPSLSISYELLPSLWVWACQLADEMDDQGHLKQAIHLLQGVERGTNSLQLRVHNSFSRFCPFIERPIPQKARVLLSKNTSNTKLSVPSSGADSASSPLQSDVKTASLRGSQKLETPYPTVLEMGHFKRGAMKSQPVSRSTQNVKRVTNTGDDKEDVKEDRVREKLLHGRALEAARALGLEKRAASLRSFSAFGGMHNFSKELVSCLSTSAKSHEDRCSIFANKFKPFCEAFAIDFNESLLTYVQKLCRSTSTTALTIQECASVAQCCDNELKKCQGILIVLRAALFCKYSRPWLTALSRDAVQWAIIDLGLRSELVEASRLLLIDGIVRRYCGNEGGDMFRVDNPRHAMRLLDFITQHFQSESALTDALDLADAFSHLSRLDACASLCCKALGSGYMEVCVNLVETIYKKDIILGDNTIDRVASFCEELIFEASRTTCLGLTASRIHSLKESAKCASATAVASVSIALAQPRVADIDLYSTRQYLENKKSDFEKINELQRNHEVYLSCQDLWSTTTLLDVAASLMRPVVTALMTNDKKEWNVNLSRARRACYLLAGACCVPELEFWSAAASIVSSPLEWEHDDGKCLQFLNGVGILGGLQAADSISARVILSVAFALCLKGSHQVAEKTGFNENLGRAVALVHDHSLVSCPDNIILQAQNLATLTETVWHVLLRGDEGVGEKLEVFRKNLLQQSWFPLGNVVDMEDETPLLFHSPALHPTWYIGDGLLLPPSESKVRSVAFCRDIIRTFNVSRRKPVPVDSSGIQEMYEFLIQRGALSVGLRLLSCSSSVLLCSRVPGNAVKYLSGTVQKLIATSAERSLGGTGNGITNNMVDSHHAVSFLLSLPIKLAFKVYRSAVPTALSTRDFSRVIALANVGAMAGGGSSEIGVDSDNLIVSWSKQQKLVSQCQKLSQQAVWWRFLQNHRIDFDQKLFYEDDNSDTTSIPYAQSLIVKIIERLLSFESNKREDLVDRVLASLYRYVDTFGLSREDAVEAFIGHLLKDQHASFVGVEECVRTLISLVQPTLRRALVLRRCVIAAEQDDYYFKDYEHLQLILLLYLECLHGMQTLHTQIPQAEQQILEAELEQIDRRCDALAILSSVFEGDKKCDRPPFVSFFRPLPKNLSDYAIGYSLPPSCGILGNVESSENVFDPLEALQVVLLRSYDANLSAALAPLCLPLGLPNGYIHARFLMEHFRWSQQQGTNPPELETDVLPVLGRIQSCGDKAALAEFCSSYYTNNDLVRLKCLELALKSAIKYSSEVEQRKNRYSRSVKDASSLHTLEQEVALALESVERLSKAKSALSDKITVVQALLNDTASSDMTKQLLQKLDKVLWSSQEATPPPEAVLEVLLIEASLVAAHESISSTPMSMQEFRRFSSTVNRATQELTGEHSHIRVHEITRRITRGWLFRGDIDATGEGDVPLKPRDSSVAVSYPSKVTIPDDCDDNDDTINFVMDLKITTNDDDEISWNGDSALLPKRENGKITSDEEFSVLRKSEREEAEETTTRVALRVAFVLGASQEAGPQSDNNENSSSLANTSSTRKGKGRDLLAKLDATGARKNRYVMECAKELLRIVFFEDSKNVTFLMRYRALRSAAILIPQEGLEQVCEEQGYLISHRNSLSACCYGSYVASECESLGLPLPHSDLGHISSIHFQSFARTHWRHNRDSNLKGSRGRFLLLLLEMTLRGDDVDQTLVETLLQEMKRLNLLRTLLSACESILMYKESVGTQVFASFLSKCDIQVHSATLTSANAVLGELQEKAQSIGSDEGSVLEATRTVQRLGFVVQGFSSTNGGQAQLVRFLGALQAIGSKISGNKLFLEPLKDLCSNLLRHVHDREQREQLSDGLENVGLI